MRSKIGADLEVSVARSEKGDLERGEEEAMKASAVCASLLSSLAVAEAAWGSGDTHVQSTAARRPRPQAFGACGTPYLTFGFASKPSPNAPWARGLLSVFWERGSPDLPACGPRCGYASRPVRPIFINETFEIIARDQASRGGRRKTSSGAASPGCLARSGDIKAGQTSRGSRT